ncbi:hypothetical protein SK854_23550 [Lentzea sp. BCCO 10_0061]|uniref:Uncharacterized protein n=1 Tax=Lentzea sokolovensis TaxID=3095429 RepID=A0ABU4V002_9PSEU|nr:hypothetical protein [Lentzea sp. BCCO 10_0061]MDX8145105.1 hypothetical protein [Lentzea sp. BCCO 10_0061]
MWSIQGEFRGRSWAAVAEWFDELHREHDGFESHQYMRDIVASVLASGAANRLGVTTSMHDLVVVSLDARTWYYETIRVFSPSSLPPVPEGFVMLTFNGRKKRRQGGREILQCPVVEAVPAFWRMVEDKFGIVR